MKRIHRLKVWLKLFLRSLRPLEGTRAERTLQRILIRAGWDVEGFENNRVFFTVQHKGQPYRSCLAMQPNGNVSLCVLGRTAVFDFLVEDMQSLFESFNNRQDLPCVYSLFPHGDRHRHVTTWTTYMKNLRPKLLRTVVPKVAHYCACNDQFALDMYRLQLEQDSDSGEARARRKNS